MTPTNAAPIPSVVADELREIANSLEGLAYTLNTSLLDDIAERLRVIASNSVKPY